MKKYIDKIKYIALKTILLTLPLGGVGGGLLLSSCKYEVDDIFEQSAAQRVANALQTDREILMSAKNGWNVRYYADLYYGGWNMIWKFNADSTVTACNEMVIREDGGGHCQSDTTSTSHFKLEQSQGVVLSFDEYSDLLHLFADPSNPTGYGSEGDGMGGDFEFRILSACQDSVVLLGKKFQSRIVLTPMEENKKWYEYINEVDTTELRMWSSTLQYYLHVGDSIITVNNQNRTLIVPSDTDGSDVTVPYIVTPNGWILYQPITYYGKYITGFDYDTAEEWHNPADKSVWLETAPPTLATFVYSDNWYFAKDNYSDAMWRYFSWAKSGCAEEKESVEYMFMGHSGSTYGLFFKSGTYDDLWIGYSISIVDDTHVKLTFNRNCSDDAEYYYNYCGFDKVITAIGGSKGQTYSLEADNKKNPTWIKFTNDSKPEFNFTLFKAKQTYPLGKYDQ